ncbi:hypothetical protein [Flavobacterium ginsenosidimutans]|uniref:Uncharacterized protein n=1 Tax=Flavobacterium ginsenosidimutans TaxID=687844 RepID=A0ABZ2Q4H4_9FLAO
MNFLYTIGFILVFVQTQAQNNASKDIDAQYLYHKAEDSYNNNLYTESIDFCEQTVQKLGSKNKKIVFLELQAFNMLLSKKCNSAYLNSEKNQIRIKSYINFYLENSNTDDEKIFKIMKFKEDWDLYLDKGCPPRKPISIDDLGLGIKVQAVRYKSMHLLQIYSIEDGIIKEKTGISSGFIIFSFSLATNDYTQKDICSSIDFVYDLNESTWINYINARLQCLVKKEPNVTELNCSIYGFYKGQGKEGQLYQFKIILPEN